MALTRGRRHRWLPFLPSLVFGLAGAIWVAAAPPDLGGRQGAVKIVLTGLAVAGTLLSGAWLLERTVPSFRYASRFLERALIRIHLAPGTALLLAAATAGGEELFFRGGLMQILGIWGQALVFGALHPISRRGWAYSVYSVGAGALFGYAALFSGSLWAPVLAHFFVNLHGLSAVSRKRHVPRSQS